MARAEYRSRLNHKGFGDKEMLVVDKTWPLIADLRSLVEAQGPEPGDYGMLRDLLQKLHLLNFDASGSRSTRVADQPSLVRFLEENREIFCSTASMQGFSRLKPHGYSGDFEIIERMYRKSASSLPYIEKWDRFFHTADGANAVRLRAKVLGSQIVRHRPQNVLSVGCGPALDVALSLDENPEIHLDRITFLDNDPQALLRAKVNTSHISLKSTVLDFCEKNALRFRPVHGYDLIWSAGLMDYFTDKMSVYFIKRLKGMLRPNGRIVVGNFGPCAFDRAYMELVGDWFLHYRTAQSLRNMAAAAGFSLNGINVESDETGINLFLCAQDD